MSKRAKKSPSKTGENSSPIKIFTYFIPAPPKRKSGYQEKEFDKIINGILKKGFEVQQITTSPLSTSLSSGMWVICTLKAKSKSAMKLDIENFITEDFSNIPLDPMIEHD